jgi:hypothetical protein
MSSSIRRMPVILVRVVRIHTDPFLDLETEECTMLAIGINTEERIFIISRDVTHIAEEDLPVETFGDRVEDYMKSEGKCQFDRILLVHNDEVIEDWELDRDYT